MKYRPKKIKDLSWSYPNYYDIPSQLAPCILLSPPLILLYAFIRFYREYTRRKAYPCERCKHTINGRLDADEKMQYLSDKEAVEQYIKAINYDVWQCDSCNDITKLGFEEETEYTSCPKCMTKTYHLVSKKYSSSFYHYCEYCHYQQSLSEKSDYLSSRLDTSMDQYNYHNGARHAFYQAKTMNSPKEGKENKFKKKENSSSSSRGSQSSRKSWGGGRSGGGGATSSW